MSTIGPESDPTPIGEAIKRDFDSIMSLGRQVAKITEERNQIIESIRQRIQEEGVPDESLLLATELMGPSVLVQSPERIQRRLEFWQELDKELSAHAGETIAWLEPEEVTVSHRDPGPNKTDINYYVNIGVLPLEARLSREGRYNYKIPVEKAIRVKFFYNLGEELNWDMGIGSDWHFVGEPEFTTDPEILPTEDGILPHRALYLNSTINVPLPIIGNEAVAQILDSKGLADRPEIEKMADMLKGSLAV
jgi:hypothetical protein